MQECGRPATCTSFTATYNGTGFGPYAPNCTADGSWPKCAAGRSPRQIFLSSFSVLHSGYRGVWTQLLLCSCRCRRCCAGFSVCTRISAATARRCLSFSFLLLHCLLFKVFVRSAAWKFPDPSMQQRVGTKAALLQAPPFRPYMKVFPQVHMYAQVRPQSHQSIHLHWHRRPQLGAFD